MSFSFEPAFFFPGLGLTTHPVRFPMLLQRLVFSALFVLAPTLALAANPAGPNIVYIYADDMGPGDVSSLNPKSAWKTPQLDRLAAEGMTFTDAHSASSLCTPSRYALLTGRYAWRGRLKRGVTRGYDDALIEPGRLTVPALLKQSGYETAIFGKWHLGVNWQRTGPAPEDVNFARPFTGGPLAHGFDRFLGISASLDMPPYVWLAADRAVSVPTGTIGDSASPKLWRGGVISDDFKMDELHPRVVGEALQFITERAASRESRPFFLYLPLASPHTPILPTRGFEGITRTTPYGDFVAQVDSDIGQIVAALDTHGFGRNTLVIFTADNGFAPAANIPDHALFNHDPSNGLRGAKSDLFEGGHRVPFIARWTGVVPAGTRCAEPIGQVDLLATCAELLGAKLPETAGEDSTSMVALLRGETPRTPRGALVHHSENGSFAIRSGKWKLLLCPDSGGWAYPTTSPAPWGRPVADKVDHLPAFQLYDLSQDLAEKNNLVDVHPEVVRDLGRQLVAYIKNGRSTPGAPQPVDLDVEWPQIAWMKSFAP